MKEVVERLQHLGVLFRLLEPVDLKKLGTRKKISLYLGVDTKGYYTMIMTLKKKSRILRKEAEELMALHSRLEQQMQTKIKKKYLLAEAPMCSKAKSLLESEGWVVELS